MVTLPKHPALGRVWVNCWGLVKIIQGGLRSRQALASFFGSRPAVSRRFPKLPALALSETAPETGLMPQASSYGLLSLDGDPWVRRSALSEIVRKSRQRNQAQYRGCGSN